MRILLSVGTCLLLGLATVAAQQQQQAQPQQQQAQPPQEQKQDEPIQGPTFRTGVDLVAVDVAVVDRRGRPIEDLRAAEFAVKIDGEVRRVVSAELIKVDVEAAKQTGRRQDRDLLHEQPHAAEGTADRHRRRSGEHPAGFAAPRPRCRGAFPRHAEPARSDRVRRLPRAGTARELHQRQASPQAGDAGAGWPAAARHGRGRTTSACPRRSAIEERRDQIVLAAVVMTASADRATRGSWRSASATSSRSRRRSRATRVRTPTSRFAACNNCSSSSPSSTVRSR